MQRRKGEMVNFKNQQHGVSEIKESMEWDKEVVVALDLTKAPVPW